jgi:hypothetical protein
MPFDHLANQHEFRVFAMKRSGHHAVIAWLMRHFEGPVYFLNNCSYHSEILFSSTRVGRIIADIPPITPPRFGGRMSVFMDRGQIVQQTEYLAKTELVDEPEARLDRLIAGEIAAHQSLSFPGEREAYLFNLEDFPISKLATVPFTAAKRGTSQSIHEVIVLRDPYNWLASRYRGEFPIDETVIESWCSQCREALRETEQLANPLIVNYDRWFTDPGYRQQLSEREGLPGEEPGVGEITNFGGGSSFTGLEFRDQAKRMDVLHRWKHFEDDRQFRSYFTSYPQLEEYADRLFPDSEKPSFL